jgi:hypothetical protein
VADPEQTDVVRMHKVGVVKFWVRRYALAEGGVVLDAWKSGVLFEGEPGAVMYTGRDRYKKATDQETRDAVAAAFPEERRVSWRQSPYGGVEAVREEELGVS